MEKSILYLFTAEYPFGNAETFIEPELEKLSLEFDKVVIFPYAYFQLDSTPRRIPQNCEIRNFEKAKGNKLRLLQNNSLVFSMIKGCWKERPIKEKKNLLHEIANYLSIKDQLKNFIEMDEQKGSHITFYSYWFDHWASILSILKREHKLASFSSRAHGYDVYDDRHLYSIPFRSFQMKYVSKVFTISESGSKYLKSRFPNSIGKIHRSYLGTKEPNIKSRVKNNEFLVVLSVSSLHPVKRVHLLMDSLKLVKRKVHWIHFGNEEMDQNIQSKVKELPDNVLMDWKGVVSNSDLRTFLDNNWIDVFVNVSESEGLPVSMMEAISYGIPILATDVGGTSEIVNPLTGKLLPKDFDVSILAQLIQDFERNEFDSEKIQSFWNSNFNAEINFPEFARLLKFENHPHSNRAELD
ncbi:MAG: glycosyltransferase [Crocinitomicaceae bacterium]